MILLKVIYGNESYQIVYEDFQNRGQVNIPSLKKPEGYNTVVSKSAEDDTYYLLYTKKINHSFKNKDEQIQHFKENFLEKEDKYGVENILFSNTESFKSVVSAKDINDYAKDFLSDSEPLENKIKLYFENR